MKILFAITITLIAFSATSGAARCGGVLEGAYGTFRLSPQNKSVTTETCVWIIRITAGRGIRLMLNDLTPNAALFIHPENLGSSDIILNPISLNASNIGLGYEFPRKVLLVTLAAGENRASFTWVAIPSFEDKTISNVNYMDTPEGYIEWRPERNEEALTWVAKSDVATSVAWFANVHDGACDSVIDQCRCFYIGIFRVSPEGRLEEIQGTCGGTAGGEFKNFNSQHVVLARTNSSRSMDLVVQLEWKECCTADVDRR